MIKSGLFGCQFSPLRLKVLRLKDLSVPCEKCITKRLYLFSITSDIWSAVNPRKNHFWTLELLKREKRTFLLHSHFSLNYILICIYIHFYAICIWHFLDVKVKTSVSIVLCVCVFVLSPGNDLALLLLK